jgi:polysaccharide biosynthesis transport protein
MGKDPRALDLQPLWRMLWRGRFVLVLSALIGTLLFGYHAFFGATPVYRATTVVILETRLEQIADIQAVVSGLTGAETEINTEMEVLRGRVLMGQVVDALDLTADPEFNKALVADGWRTRVKHWLRAAITGSEREPPGPGWTREAAIDALLSQVTVAAVPSSFVFRITAESRDPAKAALISDTIAETYMAGQVAQKEAATNAAITALTGRVDELASELEAAETRLSAFASSNNVTPGAAQAGNTAAEIGQTLRQLTQYEREAEATRDLYREFLGKLKETTAQLGMIRPDSRILSAAVVPNYHSEPRRAQLITMGFIFGLLAGLGLLLLRETLVTTYRRGRDLAAATGLPVLGEVPDVPVSGRAGVLLYLAERPTSTAAEAVRGVRTSLVEPGAGAAPKVILCASALPDEGKTTLAVAMAQNLVAMGKAVVLVDADLRCSPFEEIFGTGTGKGLMAVVAGDAVIEEALFTAQPYGFDVLMGMPGGVPGVPDVLSSDRFADLIALLRDTYDAVIIDSPPVLMVPDARIVGRLADRVVFAVRAGQTTRGQVADGVRLFAEAGNSPVSLVLTRVPVAELRQVKAYGARQTAYFQG